MHDPAQEEGQPGAEDEQKHPREPSTTPASVTSTHVACTAGGGGVSPPTACRMGPFLHFLWACHNYIDAPLESTLQQSVELAQFVESAQGPTFLPRHQQQVRWGLWEMLRDEKAREVSLLEMEKQARLYGGPTSLGAKREFASGMNASREATGTAMGGSRSYGNGIGGGGMNTLVCQGWHDLSEADEDALIDALRARGRYHARVPRHANHCQRRRGRRKGSFSFSQSSLASSLALSVRSRLQDSLFMTAVGVMKTPAPQTGSPMDTNSLTEAAVTEHDDPCVVLGTVESLTPGCFLCIAQGLIHGGWVSLRLLQLVNLVSTAHLCAAPLLVPNEALSTTPQEALCIGYHVAQHQLKEAVGFLFSISTLPSASYQSTSATHRGNTKNCMADDEKKHNAEVIRGIKALARQSLDVCVHVLAALRCLEPDNVYVVLLHAAVLSFCDRNGVCKAKRLLRGFIASSLASSKTKALEGEDCDVYDMWLQLETALGEDVAARSDSEREWLLLEQVVTGVLFSVFLELLELKERPLMSMRSPYASGDDAMAKITVASAIATCLRARDVLDKILQPRLLRLCDAADGAISTRGRQSQSLCWLLRGTLCHILNALSLAPGTASIFSLTYAADEPLACTREAVKRSDAAREFVGHPLAPAWVDQMLSGRENGGEEGGTPQAANSAQFFHAGESGGNTSHECRLCVEGDAGAVDVKKGPKEIRSGYGHSAGDGDDDEEEDGAGVLPAHERVIDVALLPPSAMRLWFVLAQTLFRSISADLVAARLRQSGDVEQTDTETGKDHLGTSGTASMPQPGAAVARDTAPHATHETSMKQKKGLAAQRAVMAERENVKKVTEARRLTERSPLGFWWRWQEAMTHHCLLSVNTDATQTSLIRRYHHLLTSVAGEGAPLTTFMRALMTTHPIVSSESMVLVGAQFFPYASRAPQQTTVREEGSRHEAPSLDILDVRLREAWQRYDLQCVQPAIAATATVEAAAAPPPRTTMLANGDSMRHSTTSSAVKPTGDRGFQRRAKQDGPLQTASLLRRPKGVAPLTPSVATPTSLQAPLPSQPIPTEGPRRRPISLRPQRHPQRL